jgi:hypothetical protein
MNDARYTMYYCYSVGTNSKHLSDISTGCRSKLVLLCVIAKGMGSLGLPVHLRQKDKVLSQQMGRHTPDTVPLK